MKHSRGGSNGTVRDAYLKPTHQCRKSYCADGSRRFTASWNSVCTLGCITIIKDLMRCALRVVTFWARVRTRRSEEKHVRNKRNLCSKRGNLVALRTVRAFSGFESGGCVRLDRAVKEFEKSSVHSVSRVNFAGIRESNAQIDCSLRRAEASRGGHFRAIIRYVTNHLLRKFVAVTRI